MLSEVGRSFTDLKAEKDTSVGPGINTKLPSGLGLLHQLPADLSGDDNKGKCT